MPPHAAHADALDWLDDGELELIGAMRSSLADELASAPVELRHDHQFARFLRGHGHNVERATEKMRGALRFRSALAAKEPYRSCHAAAPDRTMIDLTVLPHAEWVLTYLPVRTVEGMTADELPLSLSVTRLFDFELRLSAERDAQVDEFLTAMIEQRALVVHNLSVKQRRLVKCVDLRDLTGTSVKEIVTRGRHTLAKMQRFISTVQDHYPELIHRAFVFNAPAAFSQLFALISPILNERMRSKVRSLRRRARRGSPVRRAPAGSGSNHSRATHDASVRRCASSRLATSSAMCSASCSHAPSGRGSRSRRRASTASASPSPMAYADAAPTYDQSQTRGLCPAPTPTVHPSQAP